MLAAQLEPALLAGLNRRSYTNKGWSHKGPFIHLVAGVGFAFAPAGLSYVGRLLRPRHEPAPLRGYVGSNILHFQTKKGPSTRDPFLFGSGGVICTYRHRVELIVAVKAVVPSTAPECRLWVNSSPFQCAQS